MGLEEYKGVYIYAQQVDNKLSDIAFELVGKAKELAADLNTEVTAVTSVFKSAANSLALPTNSKAMSLSLLSTCCA